MIKISIDCNSNYKGYDKPTISPFEIKYFDLKEGEKIVGYQDDSEWEGIIRFDSSLPEEMQWYLELDLTKETIVSGERMEGREEGTRSAIPIGEIRGEIAIVTAMLSDGVEIESILKYSRLSKTRIINILNMIKSQKK